MKRRANGEGTLKHRKDGRWEVQVVLPNGVRRSLFGRTQRDALDKLRALRRAQDRGLAVPTDRQTVGAYLATWIQGAQPKLRPRTWIRYEQLARVHTASIAKLPLSRLAPQHVERLYAERIAAAPRP